MLNWFRLLVCRSTLLHKSNLWVFHHFELLDHLLKLHSVLCCLWLVLLVFFTLRSRWFSLHVISISIWGELYNTFQSCHFRITLFIISFEHQHFTWVLPTHIAIFFWLRLALGDCFSLNLLLVLFLLLVDWLVWTDYLRFLLTPSSVGVVGWYVLINLVYFSNCVNDMISCLGLLLYKLAVWQWSWSLNHLRICCTIASLRVIVGLSLYLNLVFVYFYSLPAHQLLNRSILLYQQLNTVSKCTVAHIYNSLFAVIILFDSILFNSQKIKFLLYCLVLNGLLLNLNCLPLLWVSLLCSNRGLWRASNRYRHLLLSVSNNIFLDDVLHISYLSLALTLLPAFDVFLIRIFALRVCILHDFVNLQ